MGIKKIGIDTTQNVKIQYELAQLKDRVLAYILDILVMSVGIGVIALLISIFSVATMSFNIWYLYQILVSLIFIFYTPVMEIFSGGRTIGKMALNTQVIKVTGKKPKAIDYISRWAFRCIDIYASAGAIGSILISTGDKAQRIGGMVSNTAVVRLEPRMNLTLNQLLSIETLDKYQPQNLKITLLSDKDMLLVKNVLERNIKYRNEAHLNALNQIIQVIEEKTGIECKTDNKIAFLKTLLKDYIVLTR
ncbi:MAG: RDD family protein [Bacteroidota bacterium]